LHAALDYRLRLVSGQIRLGGPMTIEANKELARQFIDALSRADSDWVLDHYADDMRMWTAGSLPISGEHDKSEIRAMMDGILGAFPNGLNFSVTALTAEGDRVAIEAESRGTHVSGKPYRNQYHFLMRIRDGLVIELKEYLDTLHANEVLLGG
jgi:ketosteroid isomerase-like protein